MPRADFIVGIARWPGPSDEAQSPFVRSPSDVSAKRRDSQTGGIAPRKMKWASGDQWSASCLAQSEHRERRLRLLRCCLRASLMADEPTLRDEVVARLSRAFGSPSAMGQGFHVSVLRAAHGANATRPSTNIARSSWN